ncbi:MAG: cupin domain-containing protein [Ignavibacteria bacterium]|nr:cupin domain-containing protein [Ignavibacteria bacterium]
MSSRVDYLVKHLELKPHPEGGYFREMYRSEESHQKEHLPARFSGSRSHCTSIYFLLFGNNFSALHKIKSDEIWHHYEGGTLEIFSIDNNGKLTVHLLGKDFENNEKPQIVIKAGDWFGSRVKDKSTYALVGCTVAPGFDFEDFEMGDRNSLLNSFPQHKKIIEELTH